MKIKNSKIIILFFKWGYINFSNSTRKSYIYLLYKVKSHYIIYIQ